VLFVGYIVTAIAAYFLGSIPTGFLVARARGIDIRTVGSGNMGATNVFRTLGRGPGTLVLLVDALKGFVACKLLALAAKHFFAADAPSIVADNFAIIAGICAVLGHNFTCWLNFKGGKGIATSAGVLIALFSKAFVVVLAVWIIVAAISRYVSLASIIAAIWLPIMVTILYFTNGDYSGRLILISVLMAALAVYKHKSNIQRLLEGTERRIGEKVSPATEAKQ
jgi:acyl phosphate:glycerol-3-phosphate acyltransferase